MTTFFTDNQNLWRKSRFHELGIRRMPRFFSLICTLPPKYVAILDHLGKESSFLPHSTPFPSFPPPKKMQCYPSPQILSHLYVWKDSFPLQNAIPHKSSTVQILFCIFIFHFIFIYLYHCFEFPFLFFFSKTWNSSPKLKNYPQLLGRIIEE